MAKSIFLAGAAGAIGRRLVPLLLAAGHRVTGTTRSPEKAEALRKAGVRPAIVDALDAKALKDAVESARPEVVIHQLTDLALLADVNRMAEALERNARLRREGTANLVVAALTAGATRIVAQSISFVYAPGPEPHHEDDRLDLDVEGLRSVSVLGVAALEREVTQTPDIEGIVLRYGHLYGPGTGVDAKPPRGAVHVDAAAHAALLAVDRGRAGIYNVAEDDGEVAIEKVRAELGFDPGFRLSV
ncbi:MAG: NAD-dependent epimerase/dehydratase family protein [Bradyrhizobiaceae bacterium]|nr:NAD-dependent epimerase/dehydratase family protein [Bradyrhizobiaceae bacterium]